jgi:hypothetical protein
VRRCAVPCALSVTYVWVDLSWCRLDLERLGRIEGSRLLAFNVNSEGPCLFGNVAWR